MRFALDQFVVLFVLNGRRLNRSIDLYGSVTPNIFLFSETTMALCSSYGPKCAPCAGLADSVKLSIDDAKAQLLSLRNPASLWTLEESEKGVLSLSRKFTARNFQAALDAVNAIGAIAEKENHHPNLHLTNYREVEIEIYTHKVDGLTQNDFILAGILDKEVAIDYSPKWLRENPAAAPTAKKNK